MINNKIINHIFIVIILFIIVSSITILIFKHQPKEEKKMIIREPAVAGAFYPADKNSLTTQLKILLASTKYLDEVDEEKSLRILIVPHAGYDYSGQVAAWGFKQLEGKDYSRIIILGVSHHTYFSKAAIFNQGLWKTPLGSVAIDEDFANSLINQSNLLEANLEVHKEEHSLEVEVPFLQQTLANFKIVPILLGNSNNEVLEALTQAIANNFDDKTLLVISSDLSHYPAFDIANKVDKETTDSILTGDMAKFDQKINENINQPGVDTCACGADAIKVGMLVAKKSAIASIQLINYANSGNISGDKSRVVGYASIGFYNKNLESKIQNSELDKSQQKQLLEIARQALESYLKDKKIPEFDIQDDVLNQKLGAFVTLRKNGKLRGCIGEFEPEIPLYQVVQNKAIDAALHDPRFYPIEYKELKNINIEISVLSPKTKISDWQKIELGKQGVVIIKGNQGGTFLPQVAQETGWDLETFLANLCSQKTGLPTDCYKDPNVAIYVFSAQVFEEE